MRLERCTRDEIARWPGVKVTFERRGKHYAAVLLFNGASRFVIYPGTPVLSPRALHNHIGALRRELKALGAEREKQGRAERHRERNAGAKRRDTIRSERAPVIADPWRALEGIR